MSKIDVKKQEMTTESLNDSISPENTKKPNESFKRKLIPVFFGIGVFLFDQITKWLVITYIPLYTIKLSLFGDFLQIIHVRNLGAAFSIGGSVFCRFVWCRRRMWCDAGVGECDCKSVPAVRAGRSFPFG